MGLAAIGRRWRTVLEVLVCLIVVTCAATGCGFVDSPPLQEAHDVRREQLVGFWHDDHGAVLTLEEDGTFTAEKLRTSFTQGEGIKVLGKELVEGRGSWTSGDYGSGPEIDIRFTGGGGATLKIVEKDKERVLSTWIGDGDSALLTKGPAPGS
ncbi:hypothetical protein ACFXB3_02450 [Streptomyces sp. NPDC059447]|uniref:hypothetical protein n=1 Tax=Streptomyces sp. NPDC059447 TaxID=3346834 RepID=UPI003695A5BD